MREREKSGEVAPEERGRGSLSLWRRKGFHKGHGWASLLAGDAGCSLPRPAWVVIGRVPTSHQPVTWLPGAQPATAATDPARERRGTRGAPGQSRPCQGESQAGMASVQ